MEKRSDCEILKEDGKTSNWISADIVLETRRVKNTHLPLVPSRAGHGTQTPQVRQDKGPATMLIFKWLNFITGRLDFITNALFKTEEFASYPASSVLINGGGILFSSSKVYKNDDVLELGMVIPLGNTIPTSVRVYGKVVKMLKLSDELSDYEVEFTVIDESIRDMIIKYIFQKQREMVSKRREAANQGCMVRLRDARSAV